MNQDDVLKSSWESLRKHTVENMLTCLSEIDQFNVPLNESYWPLRSHFQVLRC